MGTTSFAVGRMSCEVMPDGIALYTKESIFSDVPEDQLAPALEDRLDAEGLLPVPYHPLLVRAGDDLVLTVEGGDGREPVFRRARHVIAAEEFEFWTSDAVPEDFAFMATHARRHLLPLREAGLLEPHDGVAEIVAGIRLVPAPGHTPGHAAVSIDDGGGPPSIWATRS